MTPIDARMAQLRGQRKAPPPGPGLAATALGATAAQPERILVTDGSRAFSRRQMLDMALSLGGAMQARGLRVGSVVAFQLPNWWEACVINLASALFGWRIVPLLPILRRAELDHILPACGVEALFIPGQWRGTDHPALVASLTTQPAHVIAVRRDGDFEALLAHPPGTPDPAPGDDAKLIIFTSGSTGKPKGVIHTHDGMDALIRDMAVFWSIGGEDRLHVPSPVAHIGGMLYAFEFPWATGCIARLDDAWDPARAVSLIDTEGLTFIAGATPFLQGLIEAASRVGSSLPTLRRFVCGGASVPADLVRRGLAQFPHAVVSRAYGSSEVPLICPGLRTRAEAEAHPDTDGEIRCMLRLIQGEIAAQAPQMLAGYLDPADDPAAFTPDGYFLTGDLGVQVEERFLVITGRKKDIIIRKGENIAPLEIESALTRHPAVAACAVVGRPDPERGEMVVAFVVPAPGARFDLAAMRAHLEAEGLARQKFPEDLRLIEALPMNAIGKVQKPDLRRIAAGR